MRFVFLGPPGSGKGTQAHLLAETLAIPHVSTGEILRQAIKDETEYGLKAEEFMIKGNLVPDEIIIPIAKDILTKKFGKNGFILDGFPRNIVQAKALDEFLGTSSENLSAVIYLFLDDDILYKRNYGRRFCSACGRIYNLFFYPPQNGEFCDQCSEKLQVRHDDKKGKIIQRMNEYKNNTTPLIDYYSSSGLLLQVDADGNIDEVQERILSALRKHTITR